MREVVAYYIHNDDIEKDVLHDGFLIAYTSIGSLKNGAKIEAWLTSIMKNLSLQYLKDESSHISVPMSDTAIADNAITSADNARELTWEELDKIIDKLPEGYGKVFRLAVLDGLSHKEIAALLGIAPHSSSSQLTHAKAMLRGFKQYLSEDAELEILLTATNGVLSLVDTDGSPYGVPVSFAYDGYGHIYFHSAVKGHKIDCIRGDSRCSFCVVGQDKIVPEEFTSYFRSVIVKGNISIMAVQYEIMKGLLLICEKYSPGIDSDKEIAKCLGHVLVLRLDIKSMIGKEAI